MLVPYETNRLYYNYPIFVIGYPDSRYGHNVTTCSSAYSLGDMYCFGLGGDTDAAAQIQLARRATINFLDESHLDMIEFAGYRHGRDKMQDPRFAFESHHEGPVLTAAFAALTLEIEAVSQYHRRFNFTARITERYVQTELLAPTGRLAPEKITPVSYAGDQYRKVYRTPGDVFTPGRYLNQKD